jgi:hypothetical protein
MMSGSQTPTYLSKNPQVTTEVTRQCKLYFHKPFYSEFEAGAGKPIKLYWYSTEREQFHWQGSNFTKALMIKAIAVVHSFLP